MSMNCVRDFEKIFVLRVIYTKGITTRFRGQRSNLDIKTFFSLVPPTTRENCILAEFFINISDTLTGYKTGQTGF